MSEQTNGGDEFGRSPEYVQLHSGFNLVRKMERERRALVRMPLPSVGRTPR